VAWTSRTRKLATHTVQLPVTSYRVTNGDKIQQPKAACRDFSLYITYNLDFDFLASRAAALRPSHKFIAPHGKIQHEMKLCKTHHLRLVEPAFDYE
jgi:hypothetical protein